MKVGLILYGAPETVSGGYLYDRKLAAYLRSQGDEVRIISLPTGTYLSHLFNNLTFRLPADLDLIIEDELVHPSVLLANLARAESSGHRAPIFSLVHNLHSSEKRAAWQNAFYRQVERCHLGSVEGFIFNSTVTKSSVTALVGDTKPFVLAPPGGDRLGWLDLDSVQKRASHPGPLRLLFLASVTALKGLHVLLDALQRLSPNAVSLDVVGSLEVEPAYAASMRSRAAALPISIQFHGIVDGPPLAELLAASDTLVLPSSYEGFGIAYLEGMAFGLPAIGTTAGAIPQLISEGNNGYMIAPGDSVTLAGHLNSLASDRKTLRRLSENALKTFHERPTWEQSAGMVRAFLDQMVGARNSSL